MSRNKVVIEQSVVRIITVGIQGPPGAGISKAYVDAGDAASRARDTGTQPASTISDFPTAVDARVGVQKAASNGLATLGSDGKVPTTQLPANVINTVTSVNGQTGAVSLTTAATLLVAASNASAKVKAGADYICVGTADEVQINLALAALPGGKGKVVLSAGTFSTAAAINLTTSQTREGQGIDATLIAGTLDLPRHPPWESSGRRHHA